MADEADDNSSGVNLDIPREVWGDVTDLLGQVFGPAGQAGEWLSDKIRFFRFKSDSINMRSPVLSLLSLNHKRY